MRNPEVGIVLSGLWDWVNSGAQENLWPDAIPDPSKAPYGSRTNPLPIDHEPQVLSTESYPLIGNLKALKQPSDQHSLLHRYFTFTHLTIDLTPFLDAEAREKLLNSHRSDACSL